MSHALSAVIGTEDEAYEAWKRGNVNRFDPLGQGPLIRDHQTGMVYDATEFWIRLLEEGRKE